jgi:hypothetical protein
MSYTAPNTAKTFSLTGGDIPVENVITKLKFLSKVKPGEKINVKHLFVRADADADWYQKFLRTLTNVTVGGESKSETREFIKFIYNETIDLICVYSGDPSDSFKQSISKMLIDNLEATKNGIESLKQTYFGDSRFVSQIDAIVGTMEARLKIVRQPTAPITPITPTRQDINPFGSSNMDSDDHQDD